jgi:hypothetical protein
MADADGLILQVLPAADSDADPTSAPDSPKEPDEDEQDSTP